MIAKRYLMWLWLVLLTISFQCKQSPEEVSTPAEPLKVEVFINDSIPEGFIDKNFILGRFDPETHEDFVVIDTMFADRDSLFLQKETYESFKRMHAAAAVENVNLVIRSATRNFTAQKRIWEDKWMGRTILEDGTNARIGIPDETTRALKILEYSSMPGSSRHHWGTDIDLNSFVNSWFERGEGMRLYSWLLSHAAEYGFCQPYTKKNKDRPDGYNEEKWHWSYIPLATRFTNYAKKSMVNEDLTGFLGFEQAIKVNMKEKYILGINPNCL